MRAVVAIYGQDPAGTWAYCSGVLVGPTTVLTAAHCVYDRLDWSFEVYFVDDLAFEQSESSRVVGTVEVHPDWVADSDGEFDFALLTLATGAPTTPVRWTADEPTSEVGAAYTFVGYGGADGDLTQCLRVSNEVTGVDLEVSPVRLRGFVHPSIYYGDSGGPLLLDLGSGPIVVGVLAQSWFVGAEVTQGSLAYFAKLRDDSWFRTAMPTEPIPLVGPAL